MVPEIVPEEHVAEPIRLRFGKLVTHILIYKHRLYIPIHEGLGLIRVESDWLNIDNLSRNGRLLRSKNFSFERILLCYEIAKSGQYVFAESISYEDWLIVLVYFGWRGNTKALSILQWLAQFGVQSRVEIFEVETQCGQ
jgi:hypothetical protein